MNSLRIYPVKGKHTPSNERERERERICDGVILRESFIFSLVSFFILKNISQYLLAGLFP